MLQRTLRRMSRRLMVGTATLSVLLGVTVSQSAASQAPADCRDVSIPVSLADGQPKSYSMYGRLCVPAGSSPATIQVLVHGITYTHDYWSFPDPTGGTDRYNYVAKANEAGFATLAVDRLGSGRSSRPLGPLVTIDSNAHAMHDVIQAIRSGSITTPNGSEFSTIVYVGHSYGSWTGWYEVSTYNDVDAFIATGASHKVSLTAPLTHLPDLAYPAWLDPKFGLPYVTEPTYLTTIPGRRGHTFYEPAEFDPAVLAYDEAHKGIMVTTEVATFPLILAQPLDIRVPVMLVNGEKDVLFCGPQVGAADCSSPEALIADEGPRFGPNVPSIDAFIDPQAGHALNQSFNAEPTFAAIQEWIDQTVGGSDH
jgi:pimeloyl-ACP methyl ester carboxylesterase